MRSITFCGYLLLAGLIGAAPAQAQTESPATVCVDTNVGDFCMRLLEDAAPRTVENFMNYVEDGDYDGTFFHRRESGFVIQGGGFYFEPLAEEVPTDPPVQNEPGVRNYRGTVAMAKMGGQPDSATSQWFVNLTNNFDLDTANGGFTVFAEVVSGMRVVDFIGATDVQDLSEDLGGAFQRVPVLDEDDEGPDNLIRVDRVYVDEDFVNTATEYYAQSFFVPVAGLDVFVPEDDRTDAGLLGVFFDLDADASGMVFEMDMNSILPWQAVPGQEVATFDAETGTLVVPSARVNGEIFRDLVFDMTRGPNSEQWEFTLVDFTAPGETQSP